MFYSYLTNRVQFVQIGNVKSDVLTVKCGIPQGSTLGPLLFLLYINDLPNCSDILQFRIFADDTNIFYSAKSPNILQRVINEELNKVYQYCSANKLSINFKKTNYMLITSKPRNNTLIHMPNITHMSCIKYLGVYIDEHLDWQNQITYFNNKIAKNVGILFRLRYHLNMQMLTNLYYMNLNYGLMSWGTTFKTKLKWLSSKVNKCITCIFFANGCEDPSPFYKLLGILKFDNLIKLKTASFISQLRSRDNEIPELFSELLVPASNIH